MTDYASLLAIAGLALTLALFGAAIVVGFWLLLKRRTTQASRTRSQLAAVAQKNGLVYTPGNMTTDPRLTSTADGVSATLSFARYRMGSDGLEYAYTVAWVPVATSAEFIFADTMRIHHAPLHLGPPEYDVPDSALAAIFTARGAHELAAALLTHEVMRQLSTNQISHVFVTSNRIAVYRPGIRTEEPVCLALLQVVRDLAQRL